MIVCPSVQEPECWGSHLNRSAQLTPPARLTSQERDSLKASAQYYGLKLKSNLASLSKVSHQRIKSNVEMSQFKINNPVFMVLLQDRPFSLKKSFLPGRLPLNSLKDTLSLPASSPIRAPDTTAATAIQPFSPQEVKMFVHCCLLLLSGSVFEFGFKFIISNNSAEQGEAKNCP